jgi:hypothetical protein
MTPPKAPYLIVGFDIDPTDPNCDAIMKDVEDNFPVIGQMIPLAVQNVFAIPVPASQKAARQDQLIQYFLAKDLEHNGTVRFVVQLCHAAEIGIG